MSNVEIRFSFLSQAKANNLEARSSPANQRPNWYTQEPISTANPPCSHLSQSFAVSQTHHFLRPSNTDKRFSKKVRNDNILKIQGFLDALGDLRGKNFENDKKCTVDKRSRKGEILKIFIIFNLLTHFCIKIRSQKKFSEIFRKFWSFYQIF